MWHIYHPTSCYISVCVFIAHITGVEFIAAEAANDRAAAAELQLQEAIATHKAQLEFIMTENYKVAQQNAIIACKGFLCHMLLSPYVLVCICVCMYLCASNVSWSCLCL